MLNRYFVTACFLVLLYCVVLPAFAFDTIDFPGIAQGHNNRSNTNCSGNGNDAQLTIYNAGRIRGTNGADLDFCRQSAGMPNTSCDTAAGGDRVCSISGSASAGLNMNANQNRFLSSSNADGSHSCFGTNTLALGSASANQFNQVNIGGSCELTLSNQNSEYRFSAMNLSSDAIVNFPEGDYWIGSLNISGNVEIRVEGNVRIFVESNSLGINNQVILNPDNQGALQLVGYGDISLSTSAKIYGNVYAQNAITINNDAVIYGRTKSHDLIINGNGQINVPPVAPPTDSLALQFGKSNSGRVDFETPFSAGVTPLVFLMPTITPGNPDANDGPASVFVTSVTNSGFTWVQSEPQSVASRYLASQSMPEIHWVAITQGQHVLSDGTQIVADVESIASAQYGGVNDTAANYLDISYPGHSYDVVLSQLQTRVNNCWVTSLAKTSANDISLSLEISEVHNRSNRRCQPANIRTLAPEQVAYLAVSSATGQFRLNNQDIRYHFGTASTIPSFGDLTAQCNSLTDLTGFEDAPTFVAGKLSRGGGDGGWLRRCQLSAAQVSVVVDEDTYKDRDRSHLPEDYGFVAFEEVTAVEICFQDNFEDATLGREWLGTRSSGSFNPSIVNGRLRLTENSGNQATAVTYQSALAAKDSIVTVQFDLYAYGGSGADGMAIVLSDSMVAPQPGSFGGPLGYGHRAGSGIPGFAGGWLGVGLDEYGNFSAEGGSNSKGRRRQSVAIRGSGSGTTGYRYLHGTCNDGSTNTGGNCLSPTVDGNSATQHRYKVTVDSSQSGESKVKVERSIAGAAFVELIPEFDAAAEPGQAAIPENFMLSLTGSTGGASNIHELDDFEVCSIDTSPPTASVHHFEFNYSTSPLTCRAENIRIKACLNADCSQLFTDPLSADLSPVSMTNGGWVGGNQVTFVNGLATKQLRSNTIVPVTIGVDSSNPAAGTGSVTLCQSGGGVLDTASCTFAFATAGFEFDVPHKISNKPATNIVFRAVKQGDSSEQCVPEFADETKQIAFWTTYDIPDATSRPASLAASVNATNVGTSSAAPTLVDVTFDVNGRGSIDVNYADAGQLILDALYTGIAGTDEEGLVMAGSDSFVSTPVGLCVTPEVVCAAGNDSCPVFRKTGEPFNITVQGKAWQSDGDSDFCDNVNTPNYAQNGMMLTSVLVAPSGGQPAVLERIRYDHLAAANNSNTFTQGVDEVGVFDFIVTPESNYLNSGLSVAQATSESVGRFIPSDYEMTNHGVIPACLSAASLTYMDEPFGMSATVIARNHRGNRTLNYDSVFAKGTLKLVAQNNNFGADLSSRVSGVVADSTWNPGNQAFDMGWNQGQVTVSKSIVFSRLATGFADGPYPLLDVGSWIEDNESGSRRTQIAAANMNAATTGDCSASATCDAIALPSAMNMLQGRIVAENTYGPESEVLNMPVQAQYWNGSSWVRSIDDHCSVLGVATLPYPYADDSTLGYQYLELPTGDQRVNRSLGGSNFVGGEFDLLWQAVLSPSSSTDPLYRGQITAPIQVPTWLTWYWNWNGTSPTVFAQPRASAFFGTYRGHDRIIYWREVQ
ncbi:DUF6701 domain-containing protein [Shewanella gelidii]|uniref:DUF6701 domain-containing protein n=1 Tax=Shewanella gelidii TaxID=1642821 RepID=A0A917JWR9_9GAMM|nr:DUF6701 domain-containing protein [Shewanella gelidii]MCL1098761.1 MSHA biogenesis protein MshQ [Shewanella gelidii]GGI87795.1 hypothetical protein GCM10009332_26460 [Shewanella gelidii]